MTSTKQKQSPMTAGLKKSYISWLAVMDVYTFSEYFSKTWNSEEK
jgi:hypothetical protein